MSTTVPLFDGPLGSGWWRGVAARPARIAANTLRGVSARRSGRSAVGSVRVLTAMIDTMVFDALHADPAACDAVLAALAAGRLRLVTTHVQEGQLGDIRDPVRRKALQRLPREVVPSGAPVLAVSRTGRPVLGPSPETHAVRRGPRHAADDVIAASARAHADCLVTDDRRLAEDAHRRGVAVWATRALVDWSREATGG